MNELIKKTISLLLICQLLIGNGMFTYPVYAQETTEPTPTEATPPPKEESAKSGRSDPQPTSPPQQTPSSPAPTSEPAPTTPSQPESPTSAPSPTQTESPTTSPTEPAPSSSPTDVLPTANPTGADPTGTDTLTGNGVNGESGSNTVSGNSNYVSGSVNDPANTMTGPASTNSATETNAKWQDTLNQNLAELNNFLNVNSSTGFNYANLNTLPGSVTTGEAQAVVNLFNKLNSNVTGVGDFSVFNIYDSQVGDIIFQMGSQGVGGSFGAASSLVAKNSVTGPASTNEAIASDSFIVKEANGNDATITNDIKLNANTGGNSASYNTLGGNIVTGSAQALANIINLANTNLSVDQWLFGVVNIFGSLYGNIILPPDSNTANESQAQSTTLVTNEVTGPLSSNVSESNNTEIASFTTQNTADITSNLNVSANTGENDASFNTYGGYIETGDARGLVNNTSVANVNAVNEEGTVWLVIVNEMGKWVGKIIGAPWDNLIASNTLPADTVTSSGSNQSYTTDIYNEATGRLADNFSSYESYKETSVESVNTAEIINNVTVKADTGNNQAQSNTGPGIIQTGDANAGINLLNLVNTNVIAKKFVVVLVNVLGSFFGDVVPPGQTAEKTVAGPDEVATTSPDSGHTGGTDSPPSEFSDASSNMEQFIYESYQEYTADTAADGASVAGVESSVISASNTYYKYRTAYKVRSRRKPSVSPTLTPAPETNRSPRQYVRGIFISPAFAKASETSFAAMLLDGASLQVSPSWLAIVPLTLTFILIRRRKKWDLSKFVNMLCDIVL